MSKNTRIVVSAFSGGLDSTAVAILLKEKYGYKEVVPLLLDVGQGEAEIALARERTKKLGLQLHFIDAKEEFVKDYVHKCIKANGSYNGYPVGTSMTRVLVASKQAQLAEELGADAVAHGCTGKGNDQYRMESAFRYYAPKAKIVAPVRELDLNHSMEEDVLKKHGIDPKPSWMTKILGGDVNLWSHSMGSGQVEDLETQYPDDYLWVASPEKAPNKARRISINFKKGVPVKVDDVTGVADMILYLNKLGGENGVGRIDILEDGIVGLKSRELYEAPAASILMTAHADLELLTMTKDELRMKRDVDRIWADIVYHSMWLHPLRKDLDAFIDATQEHVSGTIDVELYKGNMTIVKRVSRDGLFLPELRSLKTGGFDQRQATGSVNLFSLQYEIFGERGR